MRNTHSGFLYYVLFAVFCAFSLSAFAQPSNNDCPGALPIPINPNGSCASTVSVITTGATASTPTGAPFCTPSSANDDVWYSFTTAAGQTSAVASVSAILATSGSVSSIGIAVYSGSCGSLSQISCATGITGSTFIGNLLPNTSYYLRTWTGGSANSATYTLCLQQGPPPPNCATNLSPANGSTPTLLCSPNPSSVIISWTAPASGPTPTGYNIYLGTGTPVLLGSLPGTSGTFVNLLPNTSYNWYVVPTNGGSDAIGCNTPLTFTTGPEPSCVVNNSCSSATVIGTPGNSGSINSTTTGGTISMPGESCGGATGNPDDDVWFSFTTDSDGGDVTIALTNAASTLDAVIQAYSGSCGSLINIGCADAGFSGGQNETLILNGLMPNTTYYFRVYGFGQFSSTTPTSGAFTVTTSGTGVGALVATTLTTFTAKLQNENALLNWHIAQEDDNKGFEVLKGYDGVHFSPIGFLLSKGNTSVGADYSFLDQKIRGGVKIFYRVRQVDNDGQSKLTNIISVLLNKKETSLAFVYPNPAKDVLNITFNESLHNETGINITDAMGRTVLQKTAPRGAMSIQFNIAFLHPGSYVIRLFNEQRSEQISFIKVE